MIRPARKLLLSLTVLAALTIAGCGDKTDTAILGETEGIYVSVDELTYQVQISRILNPANVEDQGYLAGLPEGEVPTDEEVWFGIFMRVENETDEEHESAEEFSILDTQENRFEPIELDTETNAFDYHAGPVSPGEQIPEPNSPAFDNSIQGSLILFKVEVQSLYNRPLELEIESRRGGDNAVVELDI